MPRISNEDLALPDVTLRIHQDRLALDVPLVVEEALRTYAHEWKCERGGILAITISGYRYRDEIEPLMRALPSGQRS